MEPNVLVQCRKQDVDLVTSLLPNVQALYKSSLPGHDVNAVIDRQNFLPETGAGGVQVSAKEGRIKCSNTLEARLEMLFNKVKRNCDSLMTRCNNPLMYRCYLIPEFYCLEYLKLVNSTIKNRLDE